MRCDYRNVGKGAVVFRKAEAKNKVGEIGVVATVKYRIVTSAPIHLNDVIDLWIYFGSRKLVGTLTAAFLVLAEQHVTLEVAYKLKDHIDSATVIAADSLGRHHVPHILRKANNRWLIVVYSIKMRYKENWNITLGIKESLLIYRLIPIILKLKLKITFKCFLIHLKYVF